MKPHLVELSGTGLTWVAVITANQEQVEFWLKCLSYLGAIVVSALTIFYMVRRNQMKP
jgi:ABC-type Fe3+-siderophore transport system permease subunit